MMRTPALKQLITATMTGMLRHSDELRDLDAALGDGDLGITVSSGARAVVAALDGVPDNAAPAEVAKSCAKAFANANPSTMAALVAGALLAGSKVWGSDEVGYPDVTAFVEEAAASIGQRGKSQVGDKTILDALVPAIAAMKETTDPAAGLDAAIAAAAHGIEDSLPLQSRRGRAAWLQERSIGLSDPGATAFLRLLEEIKAARSEPSASRGDNT